MGAFEEITARMQVSEYTRMLTDFTRREWPDELPGTPASGPRHARLGPITAPDSTRPD